MTLKEFIEKLEAIKKKYGGDLEVIYSVDEEGNDYKKVVFDPNPVELDNPSSLILEIVGFVDEGIAIKDINAVCIN